MQEAQNHPSTKQKTAVLISTPIDDNVDVDIRALGHRSVTRRLASGPSNWVSIAGQIRDLKDADQLLGAVILLGTGTLDTCLLPEFSQAFSVLVSALDGAPAIAFVYEDILADLTAYDPRLEIKPDLMGKRYDWTLSEDFLCASAIRHLGGFDTGKNTIEVDEGIELHLHSDHSYLRLKHEAIDRARALMEPLFAERNRQIRSALESLREAGVEVIPYRTRHERVAKTKDFLEAEAWGRFLRLYVPRGRYQSDQLATFLRLIESFVRNVEGVSLHIDSRGTVHGTIYIFRSDGGIESAKDVEDAISRFLTVLQLYDDDPANAEALISSMGLSASQARKLLSQYARDFRRLQLDTKHEYEDRVLKLRQSLENQVLELSSENVITIEDVTPPVIEAQELLNMPAIPPRVVTIPAEEQAVYPLGDISYTLEDQELMDLFETNNFGANYNGLRSDLELLKDRSAPEPDRLVAKQNIMGFLFRVSGSIGPTGLSGYISYVQGLIDTSTHDASSSEDNGR